MVLPAPELPTIAVTRPASAMKDSAAQDRAVGVGEGDIVKADLGRAGGGSARLTAGRVPEGWVSNSVKTRCRLASATCQSPASSPSRRIGWKVSAIAVKKAMNSPVVRVPSATSRPPSSSTAKKPIPVTTSTSPGIAARPRADFSSARTIRAEDLLEAVGLVAFHPVQLDRLDAVEDLVQPRGAQARLFARGHRSCGRYSAAGRRRGSEEAASRSGQPGSRTGRC